jgi:predicted dehydrogenase
MHSAPLHNQRFRSAALQGAANTAAVEQQFQRQGSALLQVGIIGCGKIADGHVEQIRAIGRGTVVAVCDREPLMAQQLAQRFEIAHHYADHQEMLAKHRLDVVHVATPPAAHLALARDCFAAGAAVFMEKPFALTAVQTAEVLEQARASNKKIGVNYLYNYEKVSEEAFALLSNGALGELVHADTTYGYNLAGDYGLAVMANGKHWVHSLPGKLFHNVIDHVVAKFIPFLEDEFSVQTLSYRKRAATGVAIVDAMPDELRLFGQSGSVSFSASISAHARPVTHLLRLYGTKDSIEVDYANRTLVRLARQTQPSALGRLFPALAQSRQYFQRARINMGQFRRAQYHYFEGMRVLLTQFYDAVEGKGPDPITPAQITRAARLIDAVIARMHENTP